MQGLELAEKFYDTYGRPMIRSLFPLYEGRIAAGLAGPGSECFGFDDAISRDHDFAPGFCLWITPEDDEKIGFALMDAYRRLPDTFCGISLQKKGRGGAGKYGVQTIEEFFRMRVGLPGPPENWRQWLSLPEYALSTVVNGKIFRDDLGIFTSIRSIYEQGFPEDVRLKKMAARLALMAQSGQYNYRRCLQHEEEGAARLALYEFVNHAFYLIFAINHRYTPFYKWRFRAMDGLPEMRSLKPLLMALLEEATFEEKARIIDQICREVVYTLHRLHLSSSDDCYLEQQALAVTAHIMNPEIRRLHLMEYGES